MRQESALLSEALNANAVLTRELGRARQHVYRRRAGLPASGARGPQLGRGGRQGWRFGQGNSEPMQTDMAQPQQDDSSLPAWNSVGDPIVVFPRPHANSWADAPGGAVGRVDM